MLYYQPSAVSKKKIYICTVKISVWELFFPFVPCVTIIILFVLYFDFMLLKYLYLNNVDAENV